MSLRNVRKVFGDPQRNLPPPDEEDEEYEPTYTKKITNDFKLLGLESSSSHSDEEKASGAENAQAQETEVCQKKNKKKKKKQRKNKMLKKQSAHIANMEGLDEIDKSLLEVDALLGPAPPPPILETAVQPDPKLLIMAVQPKYLNANEEMNRLFGPDEDDPNYKKRVRQSHIKLLKRCIVLPAVDEARTMHFMSGLSMSIVRKEGEITYFAFEHNREMQKLHSALLIGRRGRWADPNMMPIALDDVTNSHVEGLLDTIDSLFMIEQNALANNLVEQALGHMQRSAINPFNVCNLKNRLEYKYRENRPFHILLLKYMYLVTNRACHRTALELAKVLLNLDPSDPLGVLMVVDVMALRAREHRWLLDAIEIWKDERNADCLFNIKYSKAVSQFHVTTKEKGDLALADELIQEAIYAYPTLAMRLFECASVPIDASIKGHPLFVQDTVKNLDELMMLYAKLSWSRWKEGQVMNWLKRNVLAAAKKYDEDESIKASVLKMKIKLLNLFRSWPKEVMRHLSIIKPMASLLIDGHWFPDVRRACPFNPLPPADGVDRCHYDRPQTSVERAPNILYDVFATLLPRPPPADDQIDDDDDYNRVMPENLQRDIDMYLGGLLGNEADVAQENPQRHALMNSAGDVRNTLMLFLNELFENVFHNELEVEMPPPADEGIEGNEANDQNEN